MTEVIFQEKILLSLLQCALAVPMQWIVSLTSEECLLDEDRAHSEFSWPAAAAGIQGHALRHYTGKITQMSNDTYILLTLYPRKTIVYMKECVFLALAEIRTVKNLWSVVFLSLYMMRPSTSFRAFLQHFPVLVLFPVPSPTVLHSLLSIPLSSEITDKSYIFLLRHRNQIEKLKLIFFFVICLFPTYKAKAVFALQFNVRLFFHQVGLVFPLQTSIVGIKNLAISALLS